VHTRGREEGDSTSVEWLFSMTPLPGFTVSKAGPGGGGHPARAKSTAAASATARAFASFKSAADISSTAKNSRDMSSCACTRVAPLHSRDALTVRPLVGYVLQRHRDIRCSINVNEGNECGE